MAARDKSDTEIESTEDDVKELALRTSSSERCPWEFRFFAEPVDPNVTFFGAIRTRGGFTIRVGHALQCEFSSLAQSESVDAFIVSTEDGFSPLGAARRFFSADLGISEKEISERADWNRFTNERVTLIGLATRRPTSLLKGLILAPGGTSKCFEDLKANPHDRNSQEFYYHVTLAAIAHANNVWGARRLALSHLSASGSFDESIASASVQALADFCVRGYSPKIESLIFAGCCIQPQHLNGIIVSDRKRGFSSAASETWTHLSWA